MKSMGMRLVILVLATAGLCGACGKHKQAVGGEGEPCYPNGTCDTGLVCDSWDLCVLSWVPCDGVDCGGHGACIFYENVAECECDSGYRGDGLDCVDVDECAEGLDDCGVNATCENDDGGFTCTCNTGFAPDGNGCADLDECAEGLDDCDVNATCENNHGGYTCTCNTGYEGDGVTCAEICVPTREEAVRLPLAIHVMLDRSGSMDTSIGAGITLWTEATGALADHVITPLPTGSEWVGIEYFPYAPTVTCPFNCFTNADCSVCGAPCIGAVGGMPGFCNFEACDVAEYTAPEVPLSELPAGASAIITSMGNHLPGGNTPTSAALEGALDYAANWSSAHLDHAVVVVFITDGDPTTCNTSYLDIAAIATAAFAGTPSIRTYAIGLGSSLTELDAIAAGGGTGQAALVDTTGNVAAQVLAALGDVRATAVGCQFRIPVGSSVPSDLTQLGVELTSGGVGTPQAIPGVASASACVPNQDGWYLDDGTAPTRIQLCDFTCQRYTGDVNALLELLYGCPSQP